MRRIALFTFIVYAVLMAAAQQSKSAPDGHRRAESVPEQSSAESSFPPHLPDAIGETEHAELYNLEHQFAQALVQKDKLFLAEHLADNLVEITWNGLVLTKSKLLSDLGYIDIQQYKISNVKFRPLDSGAVLLTYDLEITANAAGHDEPSREYASSVWVKRDGRWLLQMHQSTPADH